MPIWNEPTTGITSAEVQAACTAAIDAADLPTTAEVESAAETGAAAAIVAADLPTTAEVQTAAQAGAADAITAANLPSDADVQAACVAALEAEAGDSIPSVVQIQSGLATAASIAALPTDADVQAAAAAAITAANLPTAAQVATAVGAQAACAAAITAAAGVAIPSVVQIQSGLATSASIAALPTDADVQTACAAAITAADLPNTTAAAVEGLGIGGNIPGFVKELAVGTTPLHTTVTVSGAGTTGTLIATPGGGLKIYVVAVLVSCTVAASTFRMDGTGASTMGTHSILQNDNLSLSLPFLYIVSSGAGSNLTYTKTTGATLVVDLWYYTGA